MSRVFSKKREEQIRREKLAKQKTKPSPEEKEGHLDRAELLKSVIPLTEDQRSDLASWVGDRIRQSVDSRERKEAIERIHEARLAYEEGVPRDDKPFEEAHDVRLRWGAGQTDAIAVRLSQGLFGLDPFMRVEGRNTRSLNRAPKLQSYLDYWHDEFWHLGDRGPVITDNCVRDGHVVIFMPWRLEIDRDKLHQVEQQKYVDPGSGDTRWVNVDSMMEMVEAIEDGFISEDEYRVIDQKIDRVVMNGPDIEFHSLEDYFWPPWAVPDTEKLPWEGLKQYYTLDEVLRMEEEGLLYPGTFEELKSYAMNPPSGRERLEGQEENIRGKHQPIGAAPLDANLEFVLWFGDYVLPGEKHLQRIEVLYHRESQKVCYSRRYGYDHGQSPIDHLRFHTLGWRFDGLSAMDLFDSIEQAVQNLINYEMDDTYMKASLQFKYREQRFDPDDHPLSPWKGIPLKSMTDFEPMHLPDRRAIDMNILAQLIGFGERRVQIGPYQQGQESPQNSRPTARGIFLLLDQARQLFDKAVRGQLVTWKSVIKKEVALWQQMMPEYIAIDVVGRNKQPLFPTGMGKRDIIGKFNFELSGNVEAVLHELDMNLNLQLYELLKDNPIVKTSMSSFYHLTEDLINSFRKKRKILPPLADVQANFGLEPEEDPLPPQKERELVAQMKARGLKDEEINQELEEIKKLKVDRPLAPAGTQPGGAQLPQDLSGLSLSPEVLQGALELNGNGAGREEDLAGIL